MGNSNLPEWLQLLNALVEGIALGLTLFGLWRLDEWRQRRKAKRG